MHSVLLAVSSATSGSNDLTVTAFVYAAILSCVVLTLAGYWQILEKANLHGWYALIPIYGTVKLLQVGGRSGWWSVLLVVPYLGVIASIIMSLNLARVFGKGTAFGLGLVVFPFIFAPMLGFGDAEYIGPLRGAAQQAFAPAR